MIYALNDQVPQLADASCYVAPSATVIGDVVLGAETSIWFGAVLRGDVERLTIGRGTNIQDNSVLHADPGAPLVIDDYVTVGHMVMLHGCHIARNCLVGIGSIIMNHARIGQNSIVGANSLVTEGKTFPDGVLIVGSPARVARELKDSEIDELRLSAERYIRRAREYQQFLREVTR
jgi:carbonic anhydrase/acetyltransferase-like protein (isoleucine patch superfamily)